MDRQTLLKTLPCLAVGKDSLVSGIKCKLTQPARCPVLGKSPCLLQRDHQALNFPDLPGQ